MSAIRAAALSFTHDADNGFVAIRLHDATGTVVAMAVCDLPAALTANEQLTDAIRNAAQLSGGVVH